MSVQQTALKVCDVGAALCAVGAWADAIQGIVAVVASIMSIAWFGWRFYKEWRENQPGPEPPA